MGTQNATTGCEVYAYTAAPPAGPAIVGVSLGGFVDPFNYSASSMGVTGTLGSGNQNLYVGTENVSGAGGTGCEVWHSNLRLVTPARVDPGSPGPGNGGFVVNNNYDVSSMAYFNGHVYAGTKNSNKFDITGPSNGCEVWRSQNGTVWTPVVGPGAAVTGGFGSTNNYGATSMAVYKNKLYVGTANTSGVEVWSSSDGTTWGIEGTLIGANNVIASSMAVYGGILYVGTYNGATGCEVHVFDGTTWLQDITSIGAANDDVSSMTVYGPLVPQF